MFLQCSFCCETVRASLQQNNPENKAIYAIYVCLWICSQPCLMWSSRKHWVFKIFNTSQPWRKGTCPKKCSLSSFAFARAMPSAKLSEPVRPELTESPILKNPSTERNLWVRKSQNWKMAGCPRPTMARYGPLWPTHNSFSPSGALWKGLHLNHPTKTPPQSGKWCGKFQLLMSSSRLLSLLKLFYSKVSIWVSDQCQRVGAIAHYNSFECWSAVGCLQIKQKMYEMWKLFRTGAESV